MFDLQRDRLQYDSPSLVHISQHNWSKSARTIPNPPLADLNLAPVKDKKRRGTQFAYSESLIDDVRRMAPFASIPDSQHCHYDNPYHILTPCLLPKAAHVHLGTPPAAFSLDSAPQTSSQAAKKQVASFIGLLKGQERVMLANVRMSAPDIKKALLELDDDKLSLEIGRLKGFDDLSIFSKADQYFGEIMTIPRLSERLACMLFRRELEETRPQLQIFRDASQELRRASKFQQVLQAILAIGNALNGSRLLSFRGGARGFHLGSLEQLKDCKSVNGSDCPTLLHYLARVLLRTDPSLINFIDKMPHLEALRRVSVHLVTQSVNSMYANLIQVEGEIELARPCKATDDRFVRVMEPFVAEVAGSVKAMKNMCDALEEEYLSLLAYYGENLNSPDALNPEALFKLILAFSSSLQKCALDVGAKEKLNRQAKRLAAPVSEFVSGADSTTRFTWISEPFGWKGRP
ncbi:hypothetical protein C8R47DRAFT_1218534 [Mycena vitilis]|nr:hypothetical protein C8R47DRAFT_1218534 [Mycena vitilis]